MSNEENTGTNKAAEWNQRLDEVREFANKNSRWPSTTAKDADEKTLAQWWSRYKYYYKKYHDTRRLLSGLVTRVSCGLTRQLTLTKRRFFVGGTSKRLSIASSARATA